MESLLRSANSRRVLSKTVSASIQSQPYRCYGRSTTLSFPMKQGTPLKILGVFKGEDPPTVKAREEYPTWIEELASSQLSLAVLRRMPNEEAQNSDIRRFLKLSRRQLIRQQNEEASV